MPTALYRLFAKNDMKGRLKNFGESHREFDPSEVEDIFEDLNIRIRAWAEKEGVNLVDKERNVEEKTKDTIVVEEKLEFEGLTMILSIRDQYILHLKLKFDENIISRNKLEGFEHYLDGFNEKFPLIEVERSR